MATSMHEEIDKFVKGTSDSSASQFAPGIISGKIKLLDFIQALGPVLTNADNVVRARGTRLLADVLHSFPQGFLSGREVELLSTFMCEKLGDHHSIQPHALYGLVAVTGCDVIPDGIAEQICAQIFKEVNNQSLSQGDRKSVYTIILNLLHKQQEELRTMEGDFVYGFIQCMESEKDPRNLILAFQCAQITTQNVPLGVFVEEMFEVVSCYFPVEFTPPPNDPHGIRREDLVMELRKCMQGSPQFGIYCLPLLLEKVTSDNQTAKLDSLLTLAGAASVYGPKCINEYLGSFFKAIKKEVYENSSEELVEAALNALTALLQTLAKGIAQVENKTILQGFVEEVQEECQQHLCDAQLAKIGPATHILVATAMGSEQACHTILAAAIPLLLDQFTAHSQANLRVAVLSALKEIIDSTKKFPAVEGVQRVLQHEMSRLESAVKAGTLVSDTQERLAAVLLGGSLLGLGLTLPGTAFSQIGQLVLERAFTDQGEGVREKSCDALGIMSAANPKVVISDIIPLIVSKLEPEESKAESDFDSSGVYAASLLAALANNPEVFKEVVNIFVNQIQNTAKREVCAEGLRQMVERGSGGKGLEMYLHTQVLPQLLQLLLTEVLIRPAGSAGLSEDVVQKLAAVFRYTASALPVSAATDLATLMCALFCRGDLSALPELSKCGEVCTSFRPLEAISPWQQTQLICILLGVVASVPREVNIPDVNDLLSAAFKLSVETTHPFTHLHAAKCVACLVNKLPDGGNMEEVLSIAKDQLVLTMTDSYSLDIRMRALSLWTWITKGLVLKGHVEATSYTAQILGMLGDETLGQEAAASVGTILTEFEDVLSSSQHSNLKLMYRQRFFIEHVKEITDGFNKADKDLKKNYLTALANVVKSLPHQVLHGELPQLMPLMVQALQYQDAELALGVMSSLQPLITSSPDVIASHLDSLLPALLTLTAFQPAMTVRIAALKCVHDLASLPVHLILPSRPEVIQALGPALDDKKRLVRQEAAVARSQWFLVGQPGSQ